MSERQKILIVDDREENLFALEKVLRQTGAEIVKATCGNDALAATLHDDFAMAILDVHMPGMSGFELADHLRSDEKTRALPIIFLTATFAHEENVFKGYEAGAVDYIIKPFNPVVLNGKVEAFLELAKYRSRLEAMVQERTQRLQHLNQILRKVRDINQLIVREQDPSRLIREACKLLVESRGLDGAWIALVDGSSNIVDVAYEGFGEEFSLFIGILQSGRLPHCCDNAIHSGGVVELSRGQSSCLDCPLNSEEDGGGAVVTVLEHEGTIKGFMGIGAPVTMIVDEEELSLFREVAGDISYALHNLEVTRERQAISEALRESEERLRLTLETTRIGIWDWDAADDQWYASPTCYTMLGYEPVAAPMNRGEWLELVLPDDRSIVNEEIQKILTRNFNEHEYEARFRQADGSYRWQHVRGVSVKRDDDGKVERMLGIIIDIDELKQAEGALRQSERKYRFLSENIPCVVYSYLQIEQSTNFFVSGRIEELTGYPVRLFFQDPTLFRQIIHPEDSARVLSHIEERRRKKQVLDIEYRIFTKADEVKWIRDRSNPTLDGEGKIAIISGFLEDITERKKAELELVKERNFSSFILDSLPGTFYLFDAEGRILRWNAFLERVSGYSSEEMSSLSVLDFFPEDEKAKLQRAVDEAFTEGETSVEAEWVARNSERIPYYFTARRVHIEGQPYLVGVGIDQSERKRIKRTLEESEEKYRRIFENSIVGIFQTTPDGHWITANPALSEIFGYASPEEMISLVTDIANQLYVRPEDREETKRRLNDGSSVEAFELECSSKDGAHIWVSINAHAVKDERGEVLYYEGMMEDITDRKRLQHQLLQAQKMESVGTLAGGVAHDFNNILQVALGYSEIVLNDDQLPERFRPDLMRIYESSSRGADLVKRLLTFSRKTDINPQPLNLNHRINEMRKMIERTIPKMIEIQLFLAEDLSRVNADPTQIDQILMNLAVNARDAMPEGGKLILETANTILDEEYAKGNIEATPGSYVMLTVGDTGCGMDKETVERIFEPFFTTKGAGGGTGLGLAMVHGIVKRHGGHIACHSKPGSGTTFRIYFPAEAYPEAAEQTQATAVTQGGTETILLVDDEKPIRELGARILQRAGYNVITASNGREALEVYQARTGQIELVILDLIMPEMGGKPCLESLLDIDPSAKVVVASGYSADGPAKDAISTGAKGFISKPFKIQQIREVVRKVLDTE